jgi:predicted dehydrogenase
MRAAIAGSGFIARVHAMALQALGVEVAALAGRTQEGAEEFGVGTPYDDLAELLDGEEVDVLHVCTPNHVHAAQALAAIERGVHVVCEKPLATPTVESAAMLEAAEEQGVLHATCYHVRGYPLVEQMRVDVERGELGEICFVHGRYLCDDVLFPASGWRIDPLRSGPSYVVGDLGTHWLDLAELTGHRSPRCSRISAPSWAGRSRTMRRSSCASRVARRARSCSRLSPPDARTSSSSSARVRAVA